MDVEIWLDCAEVRPEDRPLVEQRFEEWYAEGAEVRHNKVSFNSLTRLAPQRYLVDIGYADLITSFKLLHARLRRLGVKVFIHFAD